MAADADEGAFKEIPSKQERLSEFFRRLANAQPASSFEEANRLISSTLNAVEDELSGLPNDPTRWKELGRLFPPQNDKQREIVKSTIWRVDSLRHCTFIGSNGSFEIRDIFPRNGRIVLHISKPGQDGRRVSDLCPELHDQNL
jgi:hypothetical protein